MSGTKPYKSIAFVVPPESVTLLHGTIHIVRDLLAERPEVLGEDNIALFKRTTKISVL